MKTGDWQLLSARPVAGDNGSFCQFVAYRWAWRGRSVVVVVNYAPRAGQCFLDLAEEHAGPVVLQDLMHPMTTYERDGATLSREGLYLDLPAWGYHVFAVRS